MVEVSRGHEHEAIQALILRREEHPLTVGVHVRCPVRRSLLGDAQLPEGRVERVGAG